VKFNIQISVVVLLAVCNRAAAEPAHFWLSASDGSPPGPEAPALEVEEESSAQIHVWGRPATDRKLRNFSLNLIALQPGINFDDNSIIVHNSVSGSLQRFEFTFDSNSVPALHSRRSKEQVIAGIPDSIEGLEAFSVTLNPDVRGVGTTCVEAEVGCFIAGDGKPAWLIASVSYDTVLLGSVTELYLQVGEHGINHETVVPGDYDFNGVVDTVDYDSWKRNFGSNSANWADGNGNGMVDAADYTSWRNHLGYIGIVEPTSLTSIQFGVDTQSGTPEPIYNAATNREITLTGDDPDAVVTVIPKGSGTGAGGQVPEPAALPVISAGLLLVSSGRRRWHSTQHALIRISRTSPTARHRIKRN
jgi:hypothetical protein